MSDRYVERTSQSWSSRIGRSITAALFGGVLIVGSIILLFWNEGRAIQTERSLAEGGKVVIDVAAQPIDPANDNRLIHISGNAAATAPVTDSTFGVSTVALRLVRTAAMYQWEENKHEETHKSLGGSEETETTYTYKKVWSDHAIDSQNFRYRDNHANPPKKYDRLSVTASDATLGAFRLDAPVLGLLPANTPLGVAPQAVDNIKARIANARELDGAIYLGADPDDPQIGDYRISFGVAPVGPVSVIGRQAGAGIASYQTKAGDVLLMAAIGVQSATDMFKDAERNNEILTWVIRFCGMLAMWFGAFFVMGVLAVIADVVPLAGSIVRAGVSLVALAFTFLVAPLVIGIAWLWYRPLLSLTVMAIGLVVAIAVHQLGLRRRAASGPPPRAAA